MSWTAPVVQYSSRPIDYFSILSKDYQFCELSQKIDLSILQAVQKPDKRSSHNSGLFTFGQ